MTNQLSWRVRVTPPTMPPDNRRATAFLARAGYTLENAERLMTDIREQLMACEAEQLEHTEYGPKYRIRGTLTGPNGRALRVVTIWMADEAAGVMKFLTLYPEKI